MSKIKVESNYGQFAIVMEANVPDGGINALYEQGVANLIYRCANSSVDKELGIKSVKKGGVGRNAHPYSDEDARKVEAAVKKNIADLNGGLEKAAITFEVTGMYVGGDNAFTEERELMSKHESAGDLEEWLANEKASAAFKLEIGYAGDTHGEDGEFHPQALTAVRVAVRKFMAGQKTGL